MVRTRTRSSLLLALMVSLTGVSCSDPLGPASELELYLSLPDGLLALEDTVELVAVAHNPSDEVVESNGCGPGITVIVEDAAGTMTDLKAGTLWTCQVRDSNRIGPGETDAVTWRWAPPDTGSYSLRAAVRVQEDIVLRSEAAEVRVIEP